MSDFFSLGSKMGESMAAGISGGIVAPMINNSDFMKTARDKEKRQKEREADAARRSLDIRNVTSKPGRRGTMFAGAAPAGGAAATDAEAIGAGVALPTDSLTTPYPFVTG